LAALAVIAEEDVTESEAVVPEAAIASAIGSLSAFEPQFEAARNAGLRRKEYSLGCCLWLIY
jgi:hypothetical protein